MYGSEPGPHVSDPTEILIHKKTEDSAPVSPLPGGWVVVNVKTINAIAVIVTGFVCVISQVVLAVLQKHVYVEVLGTGASLLIGTTILRLEEKRNGRH
jgi:hypothetical protein